MYTLLLLTQLERVLTSDELPSSWLTIYGHLACQSNGLKHLGPVATLFLHLGFHNPQFLTTDPSLGSTSLDMSILSLVFLKSTAYL